MQEILTTPDLGGQVPDQAGGIATSQTGPATHDTLLDGRVRLMQPRSGYRAAIDPVLLAAATPARAGDTVLDAGCGVGAASLCLLARVAGIAVTGIEIQPELADLARLNALGNGWNTEFSVITGDLRCPPPALSAGSFDCVMLNPPFLRAGTHTPSCQPGRAEANGEFSGTLGDWLNFALRMLRPKGHLTLIHRADRLDEILALLHNRFGGITVVPVWPRPAVAARRIIVTTRRGVRTPARLLPGLVLHQDGGGWSPESAEILREGAALLQPRQDG